ncbi:unnamed protein product [Rotaria socialis]|uniref:RUN domain-containing protein n=1 Tax=Rotaria socialis TaxID=392032 RepID=A0A820VFT2_9BILA|nr:unnamed protein product [Rotaria socialis]CAF4499391.1 unnamed protein product [Rotaria socialis]
MTTINYSETINIEREKANLICLIRLTLNALIDQSLSAASLPVLDDRNADVTNFIVVLERVLCFRMRASWLSDRRYFWDFIRPACIGSCRQSIIERVEEISNIHSVKYKGRTWIKFALMEKKLSELLKLVISDCNLVRKFYHDDSIMISSQAFILCDQLAGLNTIDFSFCFKQDNPIVAPLLSNDTEIDIIDITPFLCFKTKQIKQLRVNQNSNEENKELSSTAIATNEPNSKERTMIPLEKYKLEVEQRKYFEELLQHRDRELQQIKIRYETLKGERESEIVQMENIILELQLELRAARDEADIRHRRSQQLSSGTPPKNSSSFDDRKVNPSSSTLNNDHSENLDTQMNSIDSSLTIADNQNLNFTVKDTSQEQPDDIIYPSYIDSTHSSTTTSTDDDTEESTSKISSNTNNDSNQTHNQIQIVSSAEILASTTSISIPSSSSSSEDEDKPQVQTVTTTATDENR